MTVQVQRYDNFALIEDEAVLRSASIKFTLHASGYTFSAAHVVYAQLTNELATANGYTSGGLALTGVTWTRNGAIATLDATDPQWTVVTANLVARWAIARLVGTFNSQVDPLMAAYLLSATPSPADVTVQPGNPLKLQLNSNGIFTKT